jgi:hypothetical protein
MTIQVAVQGGFSAVATATRSLRALVTGTATGDLSSLSTASKVSIISAINEIVSAVNAISAATVIDDSAVSTTKTYSSSKVEDRLTAIVTGLLNGAPAAYDTLKELADKLASEDADIMALLSGMGNRVRVDAAQTFSAGEKIQGRANIDAASQADLDLEIDKRVTLAGRVTVNEGSITSLQSDVSSLQTSVAANATAISANTAAIASGVTATAAAQSAADSAVLAIAAADIDYAASFNSALTA